MEGGIIILKGPEQRLAARRMVNDAPRGWVVVARPPTRMDNQNKKMWALLEDIAQQVVWFGSKRSKYDWKDLCTAELKQSEVVPGLSGTPIILTGGSSSNMSKARFSDLIEIIYAFGSQQGVKWSEENPYAR